MFLWCHFKSYSLSENALVFIEDDGSSSDQQAFLHFSLSKCFTTFSCFQSFLHFQPLLTQDISQRAGWVLPPFIWNDSFFVMNFVEAISNILKHLIGLWRQKLKWILNTENDVVVIVIVLIMARTSWGSKTVYTVRTLTTSHAQVFFQNSDED